jgi:serine/threonine-protein kinase PknK
VSPDAAAHDCGAREDDARTGRPLMVAAAGAGALALAAIAIPLALTSGHHGAPSPGTSGSPSTTAQAAGHQNSAPPVTSAPPDAAAQRAAPVRLTVAVAGPTATLRWKLAPGNNFPLIVDAPSLGIPPTPLKPGTTSYTEVGLQPGTEYCFKVGAVTADSSQAVTIKWSNVACVR